MTESVLSAKVGKAASGVTMGNVRFILGSYFPGRPLVHWW
jgi:hypothetical protein